MTAAAWNGLPSVPAKIAAPDFLENILVALKFAFLYLPGTAAIYFTGLFLTTILFFDDFNFYDIAFELGL